MKMPKYVVFRLDIDRKGTSVDIVRLENYEDELQPVRYGAWMRSLSAAYPYKCSCCGDCTDWQYDYCPNCGARMNENYTTEMDEERRGYR